MDYAKIEEKNSYVLTKKVSGYMYDAATYKYFRHSFLNKIFGVCFLYYYYLERVSLNNNPKTCFKYLLILYLKYA